MAKELDLGNSKLTLGKANGEAMLPAETKTSLGLSRWEKRSLEKIKISST